MKVEQFLNRNQFRLYDTNINILQSYNSKVVEITNNPGCMQCIILGKDWNYSTTTSKHVYAFLEKYSNIKFYNITNKRKYINDLLKECQKDKRKFADMNNCIIFYNESMY